MKKVFNALLALCVVGLLFICWRSIQDDIDFQKEVTVRENAVKARLLQIRAAEEEFKLQSPEAAYCDSLWKLVEFVRTGRIPKIVKEGVLSDEQMEKGLTEAKAAAIVNSGDAAAIAANGLQGFRRDTILENMIETIFKGEFTADNIDQITYIPYSELRQGGKKGEPVRFEIEVNDEYKTSQGIHVPLFEARAPFDTYLADQDLQELANLNDKETKLEHYPGLKVGSIEAPNNNAGNWE